MITNKVTFKAALLRLLISRRFSISVIAIVSLTILGLKNKIDTSLAIASTAAAVAASAAHQKKIPPPKLETPDGEV